MKCFAMIGTALDFRLRVRPFGQRNDGSKHESRSAQRGSDAEGQEPFGSERQTKRHGRRRNLCKPRELHGTSTS